LDLQDATTVTPTSGFSHQWKSLVLSRLTPHSPSQR
jgi:hypothetical protein